MPSTPKIWFLRHGQTEWNRVYRLQGQLDSPLTDQGIAQAERQALILADILTQDPDIVVSPLGRAQQTAAIALRGTAFRTDPRLMEIHAGDWQGKTWAEIFAEDPKLAASDPGALEIYQSAPAGEGAVAFQERIAAFLCSVTRPTVIVAHGLLGQVLRAQVCGADAAKASALSNLQGVVYLLENNTETVIEAGV